MSEARIRDVADFVLDGTHGSPVRTESGIPVLSAQNVKGGRLSFETDRRTSASEYESFRRRLPLAVGDVLLTIVGTIGRAAVIDEIRPLVFQRSVAVIRPKQSMLCSRFLYHATQSGSFQTQLMRSANTSSQAGVYLGRLKELVIPLPTLSAQRRIAAILDKADALRAKCRAALAQLDALTQSIFLDMFGDPAANPKGWPVCCFEDLLEIPLRNGLSPSSGGRVNARVLTLSAVTGNQFEVNAWKASTFSSCPPSDQSVDERDFLICRGNGNLRLVGRAHFPPVSIPDVTFPDTMIAARVVPEKIERAFLQHIWNSSAVRQQIEGLARTTNGTFKVNQSMLERIHFILPKRSLQSEFAHCVASIASVKDAQVASHTQLDNLFASLQHRAFRGEL